MFLRVVLTGVSILTFLFVLGLAACWQVREGPNLNVHTIEKSGSSVSNENSRVPGLNATSQPVDLDDEIAHLFLSIGSSDMNERNNSIARLETIARTDPIKKKDIVLRLTSETKEICDEGRIVYSEILFQKVGTMSAILSDLQSVESLDMLINCVDHTRAGRTQAINEFATMQAIINFGQKALPALDQKLNERFDDKFVKCRIASVLTAIGGNEAIQILERAKENETDSEVKDCMTISLRKYKVKHN